MLKFEKKIRETKLLHPRKNFSLDTQVIEYRIDPLTGRTSAVRTGRKKLAYLYATDESLLEKLVKESRETCFFCPEKIEAETPKFPEEFIPEGRLHEDEATVFPNLFASKEFNAVVVLTRKHFLKIGEFTAKTFVNGFKAALQYVCKVHGNYPSAKYAEIGCNYLFPAGSSIVHPHLQVCLSDVPSQLVLELETYSRQFYDRNSVNYWDKLIEDEKSLSERYVGCIGNVEWLVPFAPLGTDEVNAVSRKSDFSGVKDEDLTSLADGLIRVLSYYKDKGVSTFNFVIYSGPLDEEANYFRVGLKIVSRAGCRTCYINDVWYSHYLLMNRFITEYPEETANSIRKYFESNQVF